ncbi:MAG: fasciclin domain-containing protein [Chitinophagaceae bacterium]|nr:fasciclin domain-containing protein [Chitinophagaceae bacterium]
MKSILSTITAVFLTLAVVLTFGSCKKVAIVTSTTDVVNIYDYLKQHPDQYSSLVKIVDKSGYAGFLNAYGSYTLFAPTNDAVQLYLTEINKTIDQVTEDEAKNIVKFHLMEDTITTAAFKDGKLPLVTMYGQYLITSITNSGGVSSFNVNRQALVVTGNILTGNGFIHSIDHVLKPASKSVAQLISDNPAFSIFKQALVETGLYDTLNTINLTNPSRRWLTVLAETNQALADSGITSYNALKARYSNTGNPRNPLDSLYIYVAYHIIPDARYLADIVSATSHLSLQPLEVLASSLDGERVLINDIDFNGVHEIGVELQRSTSDISATNGVLHTALAHFSPKVRLPTAVYWDVADFPEVRKLPAIFRRASFTFAAGSIADITWEKSDAPNDLRYNFSPLNSTNFHVAFLDNLILRLGATGARNFWYQFRTPIIVKGKYKVWVCYRTQKGSGSIGQPGGSFNPVQVTINNQVMSRPVTFTDQRPNLSDGEMEALGWKRYTVRTEQYMTGKFVGIVDITTTDRHLLRLQSLAAAGTGQDVNNLDMIHFIPVDQHQYLPRFDRDGTKVFQ